MNGPTTTGPNGTATPPRATADAPQADAGPSAGAGPYSGVGPYSGAEPHAAAGPHADSGPNAAAAPHADTRPYAGSGPRAADGPHADTGPHAASGPYSGPGPFETLRVEEREDRVVVTLYRPEARNAISGRMISELHAVCDLLERDPKLLLLTGHGGVFAGGADIAELLRRGRDEALRGINSRLFERVRRLPMPTLAAVDGWALGGGAELSYACDLRIAGPDAVFGNPEPGLGILAAAGASWRLPELVGESVAKQVLLAGRNLDAAAALAAGLVMDVVPADELLDRAHAVLDRMARSSATALRLTKLVVDAPGAHPVADDLAQAVLFEGQDKRDRMTRFLEKRGSETRGRAEKGERS